MAKVVLSGGPSGGEIADMPCKPGESAQVGDYVYRRDVVDLELAIYCGVAPGAQSPVVPSRISATLAAREAG